MAGRMINGAAALAELIRPAGDTDEIGVHRVLPVLPELSGLLPGRGLRRGSTVAVATGRAAPAGGGTSLLLALLAAASQSGSWCAVVGVPGAGCPGRRRERHRPGPARPGPQPRPGLAHRGGRPDRRRGPGGHRRARPDLLLHRRPPGRPRPPARQCAGAVRQLGRRRPDPAGDPGPMGRPGPGPRPPAPPPGDRAGPGPGSSRPSPRVDNVDARRDHPARPRPASQRSRPTRSHPPRPPSRPPRPSPRRTSLPTPASSAASLSAASVRGVLVRAVLAAPSPLAVSALARAAPAVRVAGRVGLSGWLVSALAVRAGPADVGRPGRLCREARHDRRRLALSASAAREAAARIGSPRRLFAVPGERSSGGDRPRAVVGGDAADLVARPSGPSPASRSRALKRPLGRAGHRFRDFR